MLFKNIQLLLLALFFSSVLAVPKGDNERNSTSTKSEGKHKGNSTSIAAQCREIQKLTALMNLASNETRLANMSAERQTKIKEEASTAQTKLTTLEANTTVTDACPAINAERKLKSECKAMSKLQKTITMASNQTYLETKAAKKNTTVAKLQEMATKAQTKLTEMQSNATLVSSCAELAQKGSSDSSTGDSTTSAAASSSSGAASSDAIKTVVQSPLVAISALVGMAAYFGLL